MSTNTKLAPPQCVKLPTRCEFTHVFFYRISGLCHALGPSLGSEIAGVQACLMLATCRSELLLNPDTTGWLVALAAQLRALYGSLQAASTPNGTVSTLKSGRL